MIELEKLKKIAASIASTKTFDFSQESQESDEKIMSTLQKQYNSIGCEPINMRVESNHVVKADGIRLFNPVKVTTADIEVK